MPKPLRRVIHTMGWPLRGRAKRYREFGGSFIYPMGDDMVTLGMVVGLDYRDVSLSVHDLLQELKTHKLVRKILAGGERIAWGAKTIPEGGFYSLPVAAARAGRRPLRRRRGLRERARAQGHPLRRRDRACSPPRRSSRALRPGRGDRPHRRACLRTTTRSRQSFVWTDLEARAQHAPGVREGLLARLRCAPAR